MTLRCIGAPRQLTEARDFYLGPSFIIKMKLNTEDASLTTNGPVASGASSCESRKRNGSLIWETGNVYTGDATRTRIPSGSTTRADHARKLHATNAIIQSRKIGRRFRKSLFSIAISDLDMRESKGASRGRKEEEKKSIESTGRVHRARFRTPLGETFSEIG